MYNMTCSTTYISDTAGKINFPEVNKSENKSARYLDNT